MAKQKRKWSVVVDCYDHYLRADYDHESLARGLFEKICKDPFHQIVSVELLHGNVVKDALTSGAVLSDND